MEESVIKFEESADPSLPSTIKITGEVTILTVDALQKELLSAFEITKNVIIDISGVTELDLAGMQLLCSAHRSSYAHGMEFNVMGHNQLIWQMATASGHLRHKGCEQDSKNTCIWNKGNYQL